MNEKDAAALARVMTECYASERGCKNLPIRMIVEIPKGPDIADAEIVMLCVKHSSTYVPRGRVIQDQALVSDENLKIIGEIST